MASPFAVGVAVAGPLAVAGAWLLVRARRLSVWAAMGGTMAMFGTLAGVAGEIWLARNVSTGIAAAAGLGAGVALYAATAAFMAVARRWPPLARHTEALYDQRRGWPVPAAVAVAVLLVAPGEELLWRGLVQPLLADPLSQFGAAAAGWGAYVAANSVAASLPILLGAVVGGAAWAGLALWSGGIAASIGCHAVWTCLMIIRPPVPRPG